jgi:hypothetical protein
MEEFLMPELFDGNRCNLSRFTEPENRFQGIGIEIKTLPELEYNPNRNQKLYDLALP